MDRGTIATLAVLCVVICARPPVPLYWDEHVWLAKARLGSLALREAALDPHGDLVPRGYPIVASVGQSLLALGREDLASLTGGAAALTVLSAAVTVTALPPGRAPAWALGLLAAPLVWPHLRSAHLDLIVGLLALALACTLATPHTRTAPTGHASIAIAFFLAGAKDEGLAHVLAVVLAHVVASPQRTRALRDAAPTLAGAAVAAVGWRWLASSHGVSDEDHALTLAGLTRWTELGLEVARAATDVTSFGLAWPIVLGVSMAALTSPAPRTRRLVGILAGQLGLLWLGLLVGSERLSAFTLDGTVTGRLLVQLAPMGAWLVCEALEELPAAARETDQSRTAKTTHGCQSG